MWPRRPLDSCIPWLDGTPSPALSAMGILRVTSAQAESAAGPRETARCALKVAGAPEARRVEQERRTEQGGGSSPVTRQPGDLLAWAWFVLRGRVMPPPATLAREWAVPPAAPEPADGWNGRATPWLYESSAGHTPDGTRGEARPAAHSRFASPRRAGLPGVLVLAHADPAPRLPAWSAHRVHKPARLATPAGAHARATAARSPPSQGR